MTCSVTVPCSVKWAVQSVVSAGVLTADIFVALVTRPAVAVVGLISSTLKLVKWSIRLPRVEVLMPAFLTSLGIHLAIGWHIQSPRMVLELPMLAA